MMFDYMNLLMIEDFHTGRLKSYDRVLIAVGRPTRTYRLDELGNFDYRYEDLDLLAKIDSKILINYKLPYVATFFIVV